MNYNESLNYIHGVNRFGMNLGLDRIKLLLDRLGNPQENLKIIHVAGTNGKGSVTSFISSSLIDAGYNVGMYTSPFLQRFNERIKINAVDIEDEILAEVVSKVKIEVDKMLDEGIEHPTEFEIVTAVAFYYFYMKKCDFVCLEVGLGGRFDATNSIKKSLVSVITSISKDHMNVLGDTLEKIAYEKAGIIKDEGDVFLYDNGSTDVIETIKDVCNEKNAKLTVVKFDDIEIKKSNLANQIFSFKTYDGDLHEDVKIRLIGKHQINNAILSYNVLEFLKTKGYNISDENIRNGMLNCKWSGRMEVLKESPLVIIDGAHNEDSSKILSGEINRLIDESYNKILILGVLEDKEVDKIVKTIVPNFDKVVVTLPDSPRAMKVEELAYRVGMYSDDIICIENPKEAFDYAINFKFEENIRKEKRSNKKTNKIKAATKKKKAIIVCGSLYLIGNIRDLMLGN